MEIRTLLKANIRYKKGVFISVAVLMFIITLSLTAIISMNDNITGNIESSHKEVETGDLVVVMLKKYADSELLTALEENIHVEKIHNLPALSSEEYAIDENKAGGNPLCFLKWREEYHVFNENNTGFLKDPQELKAGEIYVPVCFQSIYDCEIGSTVILNTNFGEERFTVKGFVEEPFIGAYMIGFKQAFLSESDLDRLFQTKTDTQAGISSKLLEMQFLHIFQAKDSKLSMTDLKKELNRETDIISNAVITLSKDDSMGYTKIFTDIGSGILYAFIILLFIIVLIVMGHSVSTGIKMDYVNLGILKSQGFTKGKIRTVLIMQYAIAQVAGAAAGMLCAIPLTGMLGRIFQPITGILATSEISYVKCIFLVLGILAAGSLFLLAKTSKISQISPIKAISGGNDAIYFDSLLNVPITKKALSSSIALRQFTSEKRQYAGTIVIAAILVYFMMSMTILANCMTVETIQETFGGTPMNIEIRANTGITEEIKKDIESEIEKIDPAFSFHLMSGQYLTLEGVDIHCQIRDDPSLFKSILKGRAPLYENEIIITEIISEELGKKIGDAVTIDFRENSGEYIVSGLYQDPSDVGRCFAMSLEAAKKLGINLLSYAGISLEDPAKTQEIIDMLNEKFSDILTAQLYTGLNGMDSMVDFALAAVNLVIHIISAVFALVVVNMVCERTFLKEKKNIGIYKAVGFTTVKLRLQFAVRFLLVSAIGAVTGLVLCLLFNEKMIGVLLRAVGITHFISKYSVLTFLIPVLLICICFFVFAYIAARKIKKVSARELVTE